LYLFEGFQPAFLAQICDVVHYKLFDFRHIAEDRKCSGNTSLFCVEFDVFNIGHDDCHRARLEAFTVNKDLCDILALDVNVFNFLGGNIFALGQFKDVLLAIANL
jgi:hypothetical protein